MPPENTQDIAWLKSRFPEWSFEIRREMIRAERPGYPVLTSSVDTLLAVAILGLGTWDIHHGAEGAAITNSRDTG